jgi:hypothetical protein
MNPCSSLFHVALAFMRVPHRLPFEGAGFDFRLRQVTTPSYRTTRGPLSFPALFTGKVSVSFPFLATAEGVL